MELSERIFIHLSGCLAEKISNIWFMELYGIRMEQDGKLAFKVTQ